MKYNKGFSLAELVVTIGIVGFMSTVSAYAYLKAIPKFQASEALKLMEAERAKITNNIARGYCANNASGAAGKYGSLVVSGSYAGKTESNCPSGCRLTYTFKNDGVHPKIRGKVITADFIQNSTLSKIAAATTIDEQFIPKALTTINSPSSCPIVSGDNTGASWKDIEVSEDETSGSDTQSPNIDEPGAGGPGAGDNGGGNGNGDGNGSGETDPDAVDENRDIEPLKPLDPPKNNDEKQARIDDVAERLSRGSDMVFIEPQGFDFTVTAKPKSKDGKVVCEDKVVVKANESIVRIGADNWFDIAGPYYVRNQFQLLNEIAHPLGYTKVNGVYQVDKPVTIYNSCVVAVINGSPRLPSIITNNYKIVGDGGISFQTHGYIRGRGGSGAIMNIDPRVEVLDSAKVLVPDDSCGTGCTKYKTVYIPGPSPAVVQSSDDSLAIEKRHLGDRFNMHGVRHGGVALLNQNPNYYIKIYAYNMPSYGAKSAPASTPAWTNVTTKDGFEFLFTNQYHIYNMFQTPKDERLSSWTKPLSLGLSGLTGGHPYGMNGAFYFKGELKLDDKNWDPEFILDYYNRVFNFRKLFPQPKTKMRLGTVPNSECSSHYLFTYSDTEAGPGFRFTSLISAPSCQTELSPTEATKELMENRYYYQDAYAGNFEVIDMKGDQGTNKTNDQRLYYLRGLNIKTGPDFDYCVTGNGAVQRFFIKNGVKTNCFQDPDGEI